MNKINQQRADEFAKWFRCLGDGTRIRILNILASAEKPITVGEIVKVIGKSQSTISHHLQILAADRFVFTESDGIRTLVQINDTCMTALPDAASEIMAQSLKVAK
jgi:ArsR family transcriptional regulator